MVYSKVVNDVLNFIYEAHGDAYDKSGVPYVFHPFTVAFGFNDENLVLAGLLHDVVEDTHYTFDDIRKLGVPEEVIEALKLLTHDSDEQYLNYVEKIKSNQIARQVKLADLKHNSDLSRKGEVTEEDLIRVEKYKKAIDILLDK